MERRAWVFLLAQGSRQTALDVLAQTVQAFSDIAPRTPLAGWPGTWWSLLLAQPGVPAEVAGDPAVAALRPGPRAILLLRLLAAVDDAHLPAVLGVTPAVYRSALRSALQQWGESGATYAELAALREQLQRRVKTLGAEDLRQLELARAPRAPVAAPAPEAIAPRWRRLAWGGLGLLVLAFAASFWPGLFAGLQPGQTQPLPMETPAAMVSGDIDVIAHADYALLRQPAEAELAAQLAMLSWYAAGAPTPESGAPAGLQETVGESSTGTPDAP